MITGTFASQAAFRLLLDALAHPGRLSGRIDFAGGPHIPAALVVPLVLADLSQSVAVLGADGDRWAHHVATATGCRVVAPEVADQVVVLDGACTELIGRLRVGSALSPELGCRLALACRSLSLHGETSAVLRGPGVDGTGRLGINGLDRDALVALAAANAGFPAGVDAWLLAEDGTVAGLPRSLHLEVL